MAGHWGDSSTPLASVAMVPAGAAAGGQAGQPRQKLGRVPAMLAVDGLLVTAWIAAVGTLGSFGVAVWAIVEARAARSEADTQAEAIRGLSETLDAMSGRFDPDRTWRIERDEKGWRLVNISSDDLTEVFVLWDRDGWETTMSSADELAPDSSLDFELPEDLAEWPRRLLVHWAEGPPQGGRVTMPKRPPEPFAMVYRG